jgi:uncharacterized membrane protein YphA (DoxX/SURF4 family)
MICRLTNAVVSSKSTIMKGLTMNTVLWIVQILAGAMFFMAGITHGFQYEKSKTKMVWLTAIPRPLVWFIAIAEMLGGIGLILPALTGIAPILTPLAGIGLSIIMILAIIFHIPRHEYQNIGLNVVLLLLAAFVAYGRLALVPLS